MKSRKMQFMESMAIANFLANSLDVLEEVRRTGRPVLIVRSGEPLAEIVPPPAPAKPKRWLGALRSTGTARYSHQSRLVDLPHQDPADRFLAATAVVYGLTFVTADGQILGSKMLSLLPNL